MNPDIQNPVISGWAHQSSYYLLLCWHPESITRLLILKEPTINGAPIMNSIIKEGTMFWSCRVDNRRAAISHLPLYSPNNGSITASIIYNKRMHWWKIICQAHMHKNADKTTSKHPRLVFPVWINERARPLLITFHVFSAQWNRTATKTEIERYLNDFSCINFFICHGQSHCGHQWMLERRPPSPKNPKRTKKKTG